MADKAEGGRRPYGLVLGLLMATLIGSMLLGIGLGAVRVDMGGILQIMAGRGDAKDALILLHVRLPRVLGAALAGGALAVAGAIIQTVLDNPLAGPNIVGINAGAGFAVVLTAALFPAAFRWIPVAAFLGALTAMMLCYLLAIRIGASRMTVILAGVAVSSFLTAGINGVMAVLPDVMTGTSTFRIGGLSGVGMSRVFPAGYGILLCIALAVLMGHEMDVLSLGDDAAKSLGLAVGRYRFALLCIASALVGCAVSFAGLIGFVGLIIPHSGRFLVGQQSHRLIPVSAVMGAAFTVLCDVLSRVLLAPFELPLGIVLSLIGAPVFVGMLLRRRGGRANHVS